ncbi:MAG: PIG-L deacetylase family protein [Planctomycetota bacterium]
MPHFFPPLADPSRLPRHAVVFAPHPDDEVLGCGGLVAFHAARGDDPAIVYLSDGAAGDPTGATRDLASIRRDEARAAMSVLGVRRLIFYGFPDGRLDETHELSGAILATLEHANAEIIYIPSLLECHADHLAAAEAATLAAAARPNLKIMIYGVNTAVPANELYDISQYRELKDRALECYKSQVAFKNLVKMSRAMDSVRTINIPDSAGITDCESYLSMTGADLRDHAARIRGVQQLLFPRAAGESA